MNFPDTNYYQSRYIATVRFHNDSSFTVEGGMRDKKALSNAKKQTNSCYVRDITSRSEVKLMLEDDYWVREKI
jgi:hypothetical protein